MTRRYQGPFYSKVSALTAQANGNDACFCGTVGRPIAPLFDPFALVPIAPVSGDTYCQASHPLPHAVQFHALTDKSFVSSVLRETWICTKSVQRAEKSLQLVETKGVAPRHGLEPQTWRF